MRPLALVPALFLFLPAAGAGPKGAGPAHQVEEDLKDVGRSLIRERRVLERLEQKTGSLLQTLAEIDSELAAAQDELRQAEERMQGMDQDLVGYQQQQELAGRALAGHRQKLRVRLRTLYMMGDVGWMNLVFGAESVDEGLERIRFLRRLAQSDRELIAETRRQREVLNVAERSIREQKIRQKELTGQVRKRREEAEQARARQMDALKLIHREEALHQRAIRELRSARKQLASVVKAIEGKRSAARGFKSWKGRLKPPVDGARVEVPYGLSVDPRFKTKTRHQGVDIRAAEGAKVNAVYPGLVVFAEPFQGYGLLVILDHGGGYYSLYAHLGRFLVAKGDKVSQGMPIGTLGGTGSLKGPYLYFEVREGGRAVDPQKWVRF
jgi:septal ring factor EnvC (AmiA/AmiB activator)